MVATDNMNRSDSTFLSLYSETASTACQNQNSNFLRNDKTYVFHGISDDILDLLLYYVDDLCEEKINELNFQIKIYGFVVCLILIFVVAFLSLWLFRIRLVTSIEYPKQDVVKYFDSNEGQIFSTSEVKFNNCGTKPKFGYKDNGNNYEFSDVESTETLSLVKNNTNVFKVEKNEISTVKNIHSSRHVLSKTIEDTVFSWNSSHIQTEYEGYDGILDMYASDTVEYFFNEDKINELILLT